MLGIPEESINQIAKSQNDEDEDLEMILEDWSKERDFVDNLAVLRKSLESLKQKGKLSKMFVLLQVLDGHKTVVMLPKDQNYYSNYIVNDRFSSFYWTSSLLTLTCASYKGMIIRLLKMSVALPPRNEHGKEITQKIYND